MTKPQEKTLTMHYLVSETLTRVPMNSPMKTPPKAAITQMHIPKDKSVLLSHRISSLQVATTRHPPPKVTTLMTSITPKNTPPKNTPIPHPLKATTRTKTLPTVIILMISQPAMISMFSPRFQVSNSTYAIAYPNTNTKFSTNAICSSSAPVSTTYVQQFCFLPFNPHFPFPVLSDMPDFSSVFPQNIPLSHLYLFNLFPEHPS
jgi:hypothetical protein